jgi:glucose 1-dehydrogenase
MSRLDGKVAVVTGGARGIGRTLAEAMAREGASVVIADISSDTAEATAAGINAEGGAAIAVSLDVSVRPEVDALMDATESAFGTPSVLVCSAGITTGGGDTGFLEISDDEWDRVFAVNLRGTFLCGQAAARRMVASGTRGSIITLTSIGAERPMFGVPAYHTSKAAVSGLTRAMAVNLAHHGIRANALAPGYILTDLMRSVLGDDASTAATIVNRVPMGRLGEPDELVGAAIFLASDESAYMTGHVLHLDGGAYVLGWTSAQRTAVPGGEGGG